MISEGQFRKLDDSTICSLTVGHGITDGVDGQILNRGLDVLDDGNVAVRIVLQEGLVGGIELVVDRNKTAAIEIIIDDDDLEVLAVVFAVYKRNGLLDGEEVRGSEVVNPSTIAIVIVGMLVVVRMSVCRPTWIHINPILSRAKNRMTKG